MFSITHYGQIKLEIYQQNQIVIDKHPLYLLNKLIKKYRGIGVDEHQGLTREIKLTIC